MQEKKTKGGEQRNSQQQREDIRKPNQRIEIQQTTTVASD